MANGHKSPYYETLKTLEMYLMNFTRAAHLGTSRSGLTASCSIDNKLHWQYSLSHIGDRRPK